MFHISTRSSTKTSRPLARTDFVYKKGVGETVVEDAKGVRTKEYKLKKRLMAEKYGIIIFES